MGLDCFMFDDDEELAPAEKSPSVNLIVNDAMSYTLSPTSLNLPSLA